MLESIFNSPHVFYCKVQSDNPRWKTFVRSKTGCFQAKIGLTGASREIISSPAWSEASQVRGWGRGKRAESWGMSVMQPIETILVSCFDWSIVLTWTDVQYCCQISLYLVVVSDDSPKYFTFPKVSLVGDVRVAEHFVFLSWKRHQPIKWCFSLVHF